MNVNCKYCESKLEVDSDELSIEGKLIQCINCNQEWIYGSKSDYLLDKLEELDLNWQKKENSLTEQLKTYNSKIEELEKNLKAKYKELNEQKIIEDRIMLFEKRITNTEKINAQQAVALTIHSIFLGIEFDNSLYKLFRRVIMLVFIIFEVTAQAYLVATLYTFKGELIKFINIKILRLKLILVLILIIVAIVAIPVISWPGNTFKFLKHALEWDYFLGVITFYLLTYFMWKKKN